MRPAAVSPAYSKYASSTTSGRAAGSSPSSPVGLFGRQQNVTTGSLDADLGAGELRADAVQRIRRLLRDRDDVSRARRTSRAQSRMRSSAPAPSTTFSGRRPRSARCRRRARETRRARIRSRRRAHPRSLPGARTAPAAQGRCRRSGRPASGSSSNVRAISSVDGAHRYSEKPCGSALIAAPPPRAPAFPLRPRAPRRSGAGTPARPP